MKKILEKLKSKEWWKSQIKIRFFEFILGGFWVVYGGWLLAKTFGYMFYDFPVMTFHVAGGYMIAFIWFFFYCVNMITDRKHRKMMWGFLDDAWKITDNALELAQEGSELNKVLQARVKELEDKYEPKTDGQTS